MFGGVLRVLGTFVDVDELLVRASAVLKSQGPAKWSRGRPGRFGHGRVTVWMVALEVLKQFVGTSASIGIFFCFRLSVPWKSQFFHFGSARFCLFLWLKVRLINIKVSWHFYFGSLLWI